MKRLYSVAMLALVGAQLAGCTPLLAGLGGGAMPASVNNVAAIARGPVDFALHSFDAALYGLDAAMDSGRLQPGSPTAKKIAAAGRKVLGFLGVADSAQKLGSAPTYDQAFANANEALSEFRSLWITPAAAQKAPPLTWAERFRIIVRLESPGARRV